MIEIIHGLPPDVAAFNATGKVSVNDYNTIINPIVKKIKQRSGRINYMLVLNTSLSNYSLGAWFKDGLLGLKYFTRWRKIAIVAKEKGIVNFTNFFGKFLPAVTKGFLMKDIDIAKRWISE